MKQAITTLALLQARTSSTRLPGKVMKPLLGMPMLLRQIERLKRTKLIDLLIVVTSTDVSDDALAKLCRENQVMCYRGSLHDVLDRFYRAAESIHPEHIVRLTADCPLTDPELIDQVIRFYLDGSYDYASNSIVPTYPDGLDVEVFGYACLLQAWQQAKLLSEREHVTPFLHQHPEKFRLGIFKGEADLSNLRWTVDERVDFDMVERIYQALYPKKPDFSTSDILTLLEIQPELKTMNTTIRRNEGLDKSLRADKLQS